MNKMEKLATVMCILAIGLLASLDATACDEVYLKVGAGYKFVETDSWTINGKDYKIDGWSPYSARIEVGKQSGSWSYGISHHSQYFKGWPVNDQKEYHKTEFFVDYKWSL